jgi:hypothetical protein
MALEDIAPGVFGQFPDMSGSLSPEQMQAINSNAAKQALLASAVTMLGMSGNQRIPVSTGQALGAALGAGAGGYQSSFDNTLKQMIAGQQMGDYKAKALKQKELATAMAITDPVERIRALQAGGYYDTVKNIAESEQALRKSGLMRAPGDAEAPSPFAPYVQASSPQVRTLASQLEQGFKSGVIDEETAFKRLEPLARMEESYISRQIAAGERADRQSQAAMERADKKAEGRKPTEAEQKAAGFAQRMELSDQLIKDLESKVTTQQMQGKDVGTMYPTARTQALGNVPLVGNYLQNVGSSTQQQLYRQAQENWIRANLRKESGAVIGTDEMKDEIKTYFPQPGDKPEQIAQKQIARQVTQDAMKTAAGGSYQAFDMSKYKKSRGLE